MNKPVVNVDGGFGLVHPAAPCAREHSHHQQSHDQSHGSGRQEGSMRRDRQAGPEKDQAGILNRNAE